MLKGPYDGWIKALFFCVFMDQDKIAISIKTKKDKVNVQPSWPGQAWSAEDLLYCKKIWFIESEEWLVYLWALWKEANCDAMCLFLISQIEKWYDLIGLQWHQTSISV